MGCKNYPNRCGQNDDWRDSNGAAADSDRTNPWGLVLCGDVTQSQPRELLLRFCAAISDYCAQRKSNQRLLPVAAMSVFVGKDRLRCNPVNYSQVERLIVDKIFDLQTSKISPFLESCFVQGQGDGMVVSIKTHEIIVGCKNAFFGVAVLTNYHHRLESR